MTLRGSILPPLVACVLLASAGEAQKKEDNAQSEKKQTMKETPLGMIEFELYTNDAPKTTENFIKLAEKKYFNGIVFHRVVKGFVIQGGDPTGTGSGGKSIWGKEFADELNPDAPSFKEGYKRGVVAMANRGPNTNTSQFFIMLDDNTRLPKNYTIFGKVTGGMEVVDRIAQAEIRPGQNPRDGRPKNDEVMKAVSIVRMPDGTPHAKIEVIEREPATAAPAGR